MPRRLRTFNNLVGQKRLVALVKRLIRGARASGKAMHSAILIGPSGCGKTMMAEAIAAECGTTAHLFPAMRDTEPLELCQLLAEKAQPGDVVLIDEAHQLSPAMQVLLFGILDTWMIPGIVNGRLDANAEPISIAEVCFLLATNEPRESRGLRSAIFTRLRRLEFDPYSADELREIARLDASKAGIELTGQAAGRLAEMAQGTPRLVKSRLEDLMLLYPGLQKLTTAEVDDLLTHEGVDAHGLLPWQRRVLAILGASPTGSASLEFLGNRLGCGAGYVKFELEPYLIDRGFVEYRAGRGRVITDLGRKLVAEFPVAVPDVPEEEDAE